MLFYVTNVPQTITQQALQQMLGAPVAMHRLDLKYALFLSPLALCLDIEAKVITLTSAVSVQAAET